MNTPTHPVGPSAVVVDARAAREHGLSEDEWQRLLGLLGRAPTEVELGMVSVMWSEHCSYKSSRIHLKKFPTTAPWVLQGPGENAGVIDVGGGLAVAFKMESHNHPSFIEPYQGAATGVGGILRDIFTMGARPIASLNSLRFGDPKSPRMRYLVEGVVAGIGGYGNCMGVPTVGGEIAFDPSYDKNILVNVMNVGVLKKDRIFRSAASGIGNDVMVVGSKTGRDGIHGATMASEAFGEDSEKKRPRVQVGDPFTEKMLLEACLELMAIDAIIAIQDMGAAGLTSSSSEMAAKGRVGIEIDVARVPRREIGMTPYEVMLSESQERMLMVVKPGAATRVQEIFSKWDLQAERVGQTTDTGCVVVRDGETVVANIPALILADEAPKYDRPQRALTLMPVDRSGPKLRDREGGERLLALLSQPTIASKRWVYEQFDWSVRCGTVLGPGAADAAILRLPNLDGAPDASVDRGIGVAVDMNGRLCGVDPRRGAMLGVLECARNLACAGAEAKGATDCLNFGSPEDPEVMWAFVAAVDGIAEACRALEIPIVSGNVSLYNETDGRAILPTPTVGMVGLVPDLRHATPSGFVDDGDVIVLLGSLDGLSLCASEVVWMETRERMGPLPEPDLDIARKVHRACLAAIRSGAIKSAHDVSEGGLAVVLAECCVAGRRPIGARVDGLSGGSSGLRDFFGEGPSVIVLSVERSRLGEVIAIVDAEGATARALGIVGGDRLVIDGLCDVPVHVMVDAWSNGLVRALGIQS